MQTLGIADQVLPKSRRIEGERVATVVARGEAELGLQQVSELLPVPGVDYIGPLPEPVQRVTVFAGGVGTKAGEPAGRPRIPRVPRLAGRRRDHPQDRARAGGAPAVIQRLVPTIGLLAGC